MAILSMELIAYLGFVLFVRKLVLPEMKATRDSPFLRQARVVVQWRKYIYGYVILSVAITTLTILAMRHGPNTGAGFRFGGLIVGTSTRLLLIWLMLSWIQEAFSNRGHGLFQDLAPDNDRLWEAGRPLFWLFMALFAGLEILILPVTLFLFRAYAGQFAESANIPLFLCQRLLIQFIFLVVLFNGAERGYGIAGTWFYSIGISIVGMAIRFGLGMLERTIGLGGSLFAPPSHTRPIGAMVSPIWPISESNGILASVLVGWYLYNQFRVAKSGSTLSTDAADVSNH